MLGTMDGEKSNHVYGLVSFWVILDGVNRFCNQNVHVWKFIGSQVDDGYFRVLNYLLLGLYITSNI